ncbi:transglutaminase family protein [Rhodococcus sp. MEB064]|uniref:transglutaminase family protein n=1 Tax=Rhodococcus sp. MEB064 TaxID=1587522 RepID=UPI0005AD013A|nr:transglutaminase family protein [Rhodococcus sp. MEB064]KIQ15926.1 hypothetical protein RU01_15035 [Rhodococcus sp. MEB064]
MTAAPDVRWYAITHRTEYAYSSVVSSSYGRGHIFPRTTAEQLCLDASVTVTPTPTDRSTGVDLYGNEDLYFHVTTDHDHLCVTGRALVCVRPPDPARLTTAGAVGPWEDARPTSADGALDVDFVLDLVPAEITDEVRAYAAQSLTPGRPLAEAVFDLNRRIHRDFTYLSGSTTVTTTVADVFAARTGVCQDFARVAAACLRSHGLAVRYVSGYLATQPPPGKERMIGVDATHAWASVRMPGGQWLAFDPTNDQWVDERYVTVAWGRDYDDVPPLRGIIYTESSSSRISVSVDVAPISAAR